MIILRDLVPRYPAVDPAMDKGNTQEVKPCVSLQAELILPYKMGVGDQIEKRHGRHHHHQHSSQPHGGIRSVDFEGPQLAVQTTAAATEPPHPYAFKRIHIRNQVGAVRLDNVHAEHLHVQTSQGLVLLHRMMARRQKRQPSQDELRVIAWPSGPVNLRVIEKGHKRVVIDAAIGQEKSQLEMPKGNNRRFSIRTVGADFDNSDLVTDMIKGTSSQ
ncbi:hypothetical protein BGW41_003398 [Actinomortierella wolfii]|nr:hypothetical protein BGW41_003398 [Actinomortierella wolfii]